MNRALILSSLIVLTISSSVSADPPGTIYYEGQLTNSSGSILNGTFDLTFTIYDSPQGGTVLWREVHSEADGSAILVDSNLFSVVLGSINPIPESVIEISGRWLGVQIGSDPEIAPRKFLAPGAYAYRIIGYDKRAKGRRQKCNWSDRGSPECRSFPISEWGLKVLADESIKSNAFDETTTATIEVGSVRSLSKNSGLGGTIYMAIGDDWRVGPRLRYRRWLNDELALDFSSGVTWNILRRNVQHEVEGKMGSAWYIGLNYKDKVIFCLEYDVFPKWSWAGYEGYGSKKTQRAFYLGATAGSKNGAIMIGVTVAVVLIFAVSGGPSFEFEFD